MKNRINKFKKYGFDCLVIWESQLVNSMVDELILKIQAFNQRECEHSHSLNLGESSNLVTTEA